jgi:hypothetical protein
LKKKGSDQNEALAVGNAVGELLRLANSDLKDAGLLSSGRNPRNAPVLIRLAFDRLVLAVIATERGWPPPSTNADLTLVPDATPLKAALNGAAKLQPALQPFPAVLQNGRAAPPLDREVIRAAIAATSALLKDLADQFEIDLFGEGPAGRASPVRLDPVLAPPAPSRPSEPALPSHRKAAPIAVPAATKPPPDAHPLESKKMERAAVITRPAKPSLAQRSEPHGVEGRSPIELRTSPNNIASTAFWALMDQWHVEDIAALALIGHPGGLTKKGTRPRFKLVGDEVAMFRGFQEIGAALTALQLEPKAWLNQRIKAAPFGGATPIAYLTKQKLDGVQDTIRFVLQQGLKLSVSASTNAPHSSDAPA